MAATKRILIVQTAFLGDLLLSVPLFKHLKATFPHCEISLLCRKGFGSLLKELRLVDRSFEIEKKNKASYQAALQAMLHIEFDLLLCPHESWTSALFAGKVQARKKMAFRKWWNGLFFTDRIVKDRTLPDSLRQMSLLMELDPTLKKNLQEFQRSDREWKKKETVFLTPVPEWASARVDVSSLLPAAQSKWDLPSDYVCLFPGSVWKTKRWTEEGFVGTGKGLQTQGFQILVMGGPGEEALAERVSQQIAGSRNLAGQTTLLESLLILSRARLVVTNDSAGQHLAALVQTPTVAVFGPTVLDFGFRPWNSRASVVERQGLACRPCGRHGHQSCPLKTHACMKSIQSVEVLERARLVMEGTHSL